MPHRYTTFGWSIAIAQGWIAEIRKETAFGETTAYLVIVPDAKDALLRLTPDERGLLDAAEWVETVGRFDRLKGRRVSLVQCGDFIGNSVEFSANDEWHRGWALHIDTVPLSAYYKCSVDNAGRDDQVIDEMLSSLRLEQSGG